MDLVRNSRVSRTFQGSGPKYPHMGGRCLAVCRSTQTVCGSKKYFAKRNTSTYNETSCFRDGIFFCDGTVNADLITDTVRRLLHSANGWKHKRIQKAATHHVVLKLDHRSDPMLCDEIGLSLKRHVFKRFQESIVGPR